MHDFALSLTGGGDRAARAKLRERFPTATLAVIEMPITQWSEIAPGGGALVLYATPADLV
jgi:phosphohistidine phosphatase